MTVSYGETTNKMPPSLFQILSQIVDQYLGVVFPALSAAVIHRGEIVLEASWGWIEPERAQYPVNPATLFDLASVSKLFTTTAFLSLVSAGAVDLEDQLVKVVPEFGASGPRPMDGGQDPHSKAMLPVSPEARGKTADPALVTFRHLLTHTSGLAPWRAVYLEAGPTPTPPDEPDPIPRTVRWTNALRAMCGYPFVGLPGDRLRYSDLGMMLLGESVARLHGDALDAALQKRVLAPLGLESVLFNPVRNGRDRHTIAPTENDPIWRKRRCWGEVHDENACGVGGVAGHAGLFGVAREVALFGQAWLEKDARLNIAPSLMALAAQEQVADESERRGLGWLLMTERDSPVGERLAPSSYGHTGFTGTSLWIDPERQLVVACLTNRVYRGREHPGIEDFRRAFHDALADGFGG